MSSVPTSGYGILRRFTAIVAIYSVFIAHYVLAQDVPEDMLLAARPGLQTFLNQIPAEEKPSYGFAFGADLELATLGTPYKLYTILPETLVHFQAGTPITSVLTETEIWYLPILLDNKMKSILIIDRLDGEWRAVSLGLSYLAKRIEEIESRWPAEKGSNIKLIRIFQANRYLVAIPEVSSTDLLMLSGPRSFDQDNQGSVGMADDLDMVDSFQVFTHLSPVVIDNINSK